MALTWKVSPTTAFAARLPQSTRGRTSRTGIRPIMESPGGWRSSACTGTARGRRTDRVCREDGDLSFVTVQPGTDGLWAWPLLSAFTRMAVEWVGRGGFAHVSGRAENACGPGRAAYRRSLPRVRGREIRHRVNYSLVDASSGSTARPVGWEPEAPPRIPGTRSAAPHGSLPRADVVHKAAYGGESAKPPGERSDGSERARRTGRQGRGAAGARAGPLRRRRGCAGAARGGPGRTR